MSEQEKYSLLAKASYDNYYNGLEKAQQQLSLYPETKQFAVNTDLSSKNSLVLVSPQEVVISYRGTDPKNSSDLTADAEILFGIDKIPIHFRDRFSEADKVYQKTKKEYPDKKITLTGHSLGSTQSIYAGMKNNVNSVSFNEGASPFSTIFSQIINNKESAKKQTIYLTGQDIISNFAGLQPYNIKYIPIKENFSFIAHSLSYFLPKGLNAPDWLLPKPKMQGYKPTKGINTARLVPEEFRKKKFKAKSLGYNL